MSKKTKKKERAKVRKKRPIRKKETIEKRKKGDIKPKTHFHGGKSYGECKKCGKIFNLKRKTKHKKGTIKGVICSKCGKSSGRETV